MPSSNTRDDLPSHYTRDWILARLADVVIRGVSQVRSRGFGRRGAATSSSHQANTTAQPEVVEAEVVEESASSSQTRKSLPGHNSGTNSATSRTLFDATANAEAHRERLHVKRKS